MLSRIKNAVVAFVRRPAVQSVARHALTAAAAPVIAAAMAGGLPAVTTVVLWAALGAGARVVLAAAVAQFGSSAPTPEQPNG